MAEVYISAPSRASSVQSLSWGLVLLGLTLLGTSCQSNTVKAERAFERGKRYFQQQQFAEADIEFHKSLQRNPDAWEPRYYVARIDLKLGRWQDAHTGLNDVLERNPRAVPARLDLAELLLASGQTEPAAIQLDEVQLLDPKNPRAQALRAGLYIVQQDFSRAIEECDKARRLAPEEAIIWTECGFARVSAKQYEAAETDFRRALELNSDSPENYHNLSTLLHLQGRDKEIEPLLQWGIQKHPKSLDFVFLLADAYLRDGRPTQVDQLFAELKKRAGEFPDLAMDLGDFWIWRSQLVRAVAELEPVQAKQPNLLVEKKLVSAYLTLGRIADADRLVRAVLKHDPQDTEGRGFDGALSYLHGDYPAAVEKLQLVLKDDPDSPLANYYLGLSWAAADQPQKAKAAFNDCVRVNANFVQAYAKLSELSIRTRDGNTAAEYAKRAIRIDPSFVDGYLLLAQAQMLSKDLAGAERTVNAIQTLPTIPAEFHEVAAQFYTLKGDESAARKQYEQAVTLAPQPITVLTRFSNFQADHGHTASAIRLVKDSADKFRSQPAYDNVLAGLYLRNRDLGSAEAECRKALELDPQNWDAHFLLGTVLQQRTRAEDALAQYNEATRLNPRQIAPSILAGNLLMTRGDYERAKPLFDAALQQDPNSLSAQASLARWYGEQGRNLDVALTMAEQIKKNLPDDQTVADTLGWIYYKKGDYSLALQQLQPAATALPENALAQYHLGMTYLQLGQKEKGQRSLHNSLKLGLSPSTLALDAEQQLKKLSRETTSATSTGPLPRLTEVLPIDDARRASK